MNNSLQNTLSDLYTDEELVRMMPSKVTWTPYQLYECFPKSSAHAKAKIKELRAEVFWLQEMPRSELRDEFMRHFVDEVFIDYPIAQRMKHIEFLKKYVDLCRNKRLGRGNDLKEAIERAKQVPVTNFIEFRGEFAKCLWHNEKSGSMKYYTKQNKVHCFGCNKGGDVIDVIRQIRQCTFLDAVNFLVGK